MRATPILSGFFMASVPGRRRQVCGSPADQRVNRVSMMMMNSVLIIGCLVVSPFTWSGEEVAITRSLFKCQEVGLASITPWMNRHPGMAFKKIDCIERDSEQ